MTFKEAYTSLKKLYKKLMFPEGQKGMTMQEIDGMDAFFFEELMGKEEEKVVYIDQIM